MSLGQIIGLVFNCQIRPLVYRVRMFLRLGLGIGIIFSKQHQRDGRVILGISDTTICLVVNAQKTSERNCNFSFQTKIVYRIIKMYILDKTKCRIPTTKSAGWVAREAMGTFYFIVSRLNNVR